MSARAVSGNVAAGFPSEPAPKQEARTRIDIVVEDENWREHDLRPAIRRAIKAVLKAEGQNGTLTLLLADDATLQRLNRDFRGKDKPTNVLAFPAAPGLNGHLGDIAISHGVAAREAAAADKPLADHVLHLCVHGTLHLLGYDHENDRDAAVMEVKEVQILAGLGIADPYVVTA